MSGLSEWVWRGRFCLAQFDIEAKNGNVQVVNPAEILVARKPWLYRAMECIVGGRTAYRFTLWYDLRLLKKCTHIYMVGDDWNLSRGARLERLKAREWNIKLLEL